jgi:hypothetical protein
MERMPCHLQTLCVAGAALVLAACGGDERAPTNPNIEAPVVLSDVADQNKAYAYAYGMGLSAGCNPDVLLQGDELVPGSEAAQNFAERLQENPAETRAGFAAGLDRGRQERNIEQSDVC